MHIKVKAPYTARHDMATRKPPNQTAARATCRAKDLAADTQTRHDGYIMLSQAATVLLSSPSKTAGTETRTT